MKRFLSLFIVMLLIVSNGIMVFGNACDYENSWAKNEIRYMKEKQIISGYQDGTFKPNNNMKKAEFFRVINGLMGYTEKSKSNFLDVKETDWFYEEVQKGIGAKYIEETNFLNPNSNITREEAAKIISFIFKVDKDEEIEKEFFDYNLISNEVKGVFGGLKKLGYISGYPDGTVRPKGEITRAEVVRILHNISGEIINVDDTVSKDIKTNLVVNTAGVVLKNMTIEGNLYLTEGIGEGDITIDNVVVKGELIVKGGGAHGVFIKDSQISKLIVDKQQGLVRVVLENTIIEELKNLKEVKLEIGNGTEIKIVELDGKAEVTVEKGATIVTLNVVSKEIVIESKGIIQFIKTEKEIKINGKTIRANTEIKLEKEKLKDDTKPSEDINNFNEYIPPDMPPTPSPVTVRSINTIDPVTVDFGTAKESIELPSKIKLVLSNNTNTEVNVIWNNNSYDGNTVGSYIFEGNYNLPEGVTGVKPEVKIIVIVKEKPVEPKETAYEFIAEINKTEYDINENIILSGTVLKDNIGLDGVDITFKVEDSEGNLVTLDQFITKIEGDFEYIFKIPQESLIGVYNLTIKANEPVNKVTNLKFEIKAVGVTRIELNKTEFTLEVEETEALIATITPENATNKDVIWKSSNTEVATVDENGKVTGIGAGETTITATTVDGAKMATCNITVTAKVLNIEIDIEYFDGKEAWLTAYPSTCFEVTNAVNVPENAEFYKVVLGDEVSKTGKIGGYNAILDISVEEFESQLRASEYITVQLFKDNMAKEKVGEVQVTFELSKVPKEVKVTIENNNEVITKISVGIGKHFPDEGDLIVNVLGLENDEIESVLIESSNKNIVTITQRQAWPEGGFPHRTRAFGKAVSKGEAIITATVNALDGNVYTAEIGITVTGPVVNVTEVTLNKTELTLEVEETETLIATITPENATNKDVIWESSNTEVATVDENGKVTGIGAGETIITITTVDGVKVATCIVTVNEHEDEKIEAVIEYYDDYMGGVGFLVQFSNLSEDANYYNITLGDITSTSDRISSEYDVSMAISIEEFEVLLETEKTVTVKLFEDLGLTNKVGEVIVVPISMEW